MFGLTGGGTCTATESEIAVANFVELEQSSSYLTSGL